MAARKRSNPSRSVPSEASAPAVDFETGDPPVTDRKRKATGMAQGWGTAKTKKRINGTNGSLPVGAMPPAPPPILILVDDLNDELGPEPVYGQYPRNFITKILPWMRCERREILHVCSGSLPVGEGIRVDRRIAAMPDIIADGRHLPLADGSMAAVLIDPPYTSHYARELYGVDYPRPSHLLREAARVVRMGGRIGFVHYISPKPPAGTTVVKSFGCSTGFDMPMRAVTIYERDQRQLF